MDNNIIQLDDRTRMKFKIKYGTSCAKPTEEEIEAGFHDDPWAEQAAAPVRLDSPREEPQN